MSDFKISPSLASTPLLDLKTAVQDLVESGVDYIHFDIEDGSFVPVMTLGTKILADLRPVTDLPFDVHLMMVNPDWLIPELIQDGADRISIHYEACPYPRKTLRLIVDGGCSAGLAFNPATPIPDLEYLAHYLSFLVILTTEPEGPDCPFLPAVLNKVKEGKKNQYLKDLEWVVDGGVNSDNIQEVIRAGADTVVVGRAAFQGGKISQNISKLRKQG